MAMTGPEVLRIEMAENDAGAKTIKGYLTALLERLWEQGEGFSGKRPFGNSGWEYDIYKALISAGAVPGSLDSDGYVQELNDDDKRAADSMIFEAIQAL